MEKIQKNKNLYIKKTKPLLRREMNRLFFTETMVESIFFIILFLFQFFFYYLNSFSFE